MIEVRGLTKRYGEVTAVRDLSFDVLPGRVTGFLGPNGAGKTTPAHGLAARAETVPDSLVAGHYSHREYD